MIYVKDKLKRKCSFQLKKSCTINTVIQRISNKSTRTGVDTSQEERQMQNYIEYSLYIYIN